MQKDQQELVLGRSLLKSYLFFGASLGDVEPCEKMEA